ncbi:unnamed protein product [Dovyalis caffra]|uniref:Uncharacterized protein n=1 Tax=Dovyalis caffra TaxID=77055 RepID=A0AAV1QV73_9ROSI|nr:unnamed protein product [Dovyalis caffra]
MIGRVVNENVRREGREFDHEPVQKNTGWQDFEDVEETFSFSDLSLENCDTYWNNFSKQDRSSSFDHQDFFEFFSEDLTGSTASSINSADSIIFCGKLIPYKRDQTEVAETEQSQEIAAQPKQTKKSSIFSSNLSHFLNEGAAARSNTSPNKKKQDKSDKACQSTNKGYATKKLSVDRKYDSSMRKGSNFSPLMKTGCYSFRLGVEKFPMEMDLSDMKTRQSKRTPTPTRMFPISDDECDQTDKSGKGKREKSSWGLFRGKYSLGCIPQV